MPLHQRRKSNSSQGENPGHASSSTAEQSVTGMVTDASSKISFKIRRTVHWDDLERWQRDNHFIHTGYRPASGSFVVSYRSLGYVHNETVNIYTHLIPAITSVPFALYLHNAISTRYESATHGDVLALSCFFVGVAFCLGMSSNFHTISNHSNSVARIGNAMDYIGIVGLITGSFVPSVYYGFYCTPRLQQMYWTMILTPGLAPVSRGLVCFHGALYRLSGATWAIDIWGGANGEANWAILAYTTGHFVYIGAIIYAARVPERWYPGKFDILGNSHQIFHVLVVIAALSHLTGLLHAFDYRHSDLALPCL
ncbi:hypothetical protein ACJ72_02351 [Emergomyces africanus]|uniref:Hemolysin-III channel protein Izh2 n=1 Tax=Emergomyces africanus TaxID=1955775 RepID=A0A1B7P2T1_9EURO|nr:hypothetical protein ACJ72_02351 [Emergomyces africanus]